MNKREVKRAIALANDFVNILKDYTYSLDEFFSTQENIDNNSYLYNEYVYLIENINNSMKKRGFN